MIAVKIHLRIADWNGIKNELVAELIHKPIERFLNTTNNVRVEIDKENREIVVSCSPMLTESRIPIYMQNAKFRESRSILSSKVKEELMEEKEKYIAFMFVETIMDFWLKFGAKWFYVEYGIESMDNVTMFFDRGMGKEEINGYWFRNTTNGYNLKGDFWNQEWTKDCHTDPTTKGGRL